MPLSDGPPPPGHRMLQMVRTLAQFTIALEDMRELGDAAGTALSSPSPARRAAEETPERSGSCDGSRSSPTGNGVTAEVRWGGGEEGKGVLLQGVAAWCSRQGECPSPAPGAADHHLSDSRHPRSCLGV